MRKTYKANTNVSINVVLKSKKNLHISFVPLSNGSSTFTTDNEEIINAIESHYNFGKLFRLEESVMDLGDTFEKNGTKTESTDTQTIGRTGKSEPELKRVKVPDIGSAKDYLVDVCGISRTLLRTEKSIMEQAQACGIKFYGINGEE